MKLYLKDENLLSVNKELKLEILNLDDFVSIIKKNSNSVPAGHFEAILLYKLVDKNKEYFGKTICNSYDGFKNEIDNDSLYKVELVNWSFSDDSDNYLEFNIVKKRNNERDKIIDESLKKIEEIEKDKNFKEPKMSEEDKKMIIDAIDERIQEIEGTYDKND